MSIMTRKRQPVELLHAVHRATTYTYKPSISTPRKNNKQSYNNKQRELFTNSRFSLDNFVKIAKCNNFLVR